MEAALAACQLEFTNACKLACAECPRILMSRPVGIMPLELVKIIVRDAIDYNPNIGFNVNGLGEPLMYPYFSEAIQYMQSCNAKHVDLFTSLVAQDKMVYKAMDAIEASNMHFTICVTKHLYDNHGTPQIEDKDFDSKLMRVLALRSDVDRHIGMVLTKFHTPEDVETFTRRYEGTVKKGNFHIIKHLNPWFNLVKDMASAEFGADPDQIHRNICDYPFILLHVGWNGDVIICCTDDVDGECVLGHIKEPGDLKKVWHGDLMNEIRRKHNAYQIDMAPCTKCSRTAWARIPQQATA